LPVGATELACHPGYADDLESDYRAERSREVASLCDPIIRSTLMKHAIQLHSFADDEIRQHFRAARRPTRAASPDH